MELRSDEGGKASASTFVAGPHVLGPSHPRPPESTTRGTKTQFIIVITFSGGILIRPQTATLVHVWSRGWKWGPGGTKHWALRLRQQKLIQINKDRPKSTQKSTKWGTASHEQRQQVLHSRPLARHELR